MPSQHDPNRRAVTYRLPADVVAAARTLAAQRGETMTAVVERALRLYIG